MSLKILKDITYYKRADGTSCEGYIPDIQELKQEAIKWIKELKSKDGKGWYCLNCQSNNECNEEHNQIYSSNYDGENISGAINMLIHFFNITEEDLQ